MKHVLVTGGGGFLGIHLVRRLRERGVAVRSFQRSFYPELDQLGVQQFRGDLAVDRNTLNQAAAGCDLVFHVAAKAGVWGSYDSYHQANVEGTLNVLNACHKAGIQRLVYTSSPSVTFDGRDQEGVDESAPYPKSFLAHYPATKAKAEQMVVEFADDRLATVSLRPHLIWGPGDQHLVPRVVERAEAGRLRLVGDDTKLVDTLYIDNCVDAHLAAAERLAPGAAISGKTYFITNGEPLPMAAILNGILKAAGKTPVEKRVSPRLAYVVGTVMETGAGLLRMRNEPPMTRFVAAQLGTAHWFNIEAAKRDLGYEPAVSMAEGFRRLAEAFQREGAWWRR
ncbi:NAD-dependent epimerase/dehydratase family protein [Acanthopleuribacter pedis]|uniref:NAD-dependent epimerase/dehydratase family protein n=1 Tax=Acanthopleuribacter pedis TaxID=442870 RepID=A0A8J7QFT4_9BACT|nr:NAD-dependent epimerase/dehydratase family protein [Acanthopleuribacter pedis]